MDKDRVCDKFNIPGLIIANEKISEIGMINYTQENEGLVGISDMTFHPQDDSVLSNETDLNVTFSVKAVTNDVQPEKKEEETESLAIIREISNILNTQLSPKSVEICLRLIEEGADHTALAQLLKNWRRSKDPNSPKKSNSKNRSSTTMEREWRT